MSTILYQLYYIHCTISTILYPLYYIHNTISIILYPLYYIYYTISTTLYPQFYVHYNKPTILPVYILSLHQINFCNLCHVLTFQFTSPTRPQQPPEQPACRAAGTETSLHPRPRLQSLHHGTSCCSTDDRR